MVWVAFVLYVLGFLVCATLFFELSTDIEGMDGITLLVCITFWPVIVAVAAIRMFFKGLFR